MARDPCAVRQSLEPGEVSGVERARQGDRGRGLLAHRQRGGQALVGQFEDSSQAGRYIVSLGDATFEDRMTFHVERLSHLADPTRVAGLGRVAVEEVGDSPAEALFAVADDGFEAARVIASVDEQVGGFLKERG